MTLPAGFLDELHGRLTLSRIVGRKVTWDARKSNPGKGDWWAACPFHQEKSASFHVDDRKGYYYCFGCQAKGDAIGFLKAAENLGFMEAVEVLAREAGMALPAPDPRAKAEADGRARLVEVMEQAVQYHRLQLRTARAHAARDYLTRRGLTEASLTRFEIGYAGEERAGLTGALTAKGIPVATLAEAGLTIIPEDGGAPYDRFRSRIMFPIRDPRGRAIAFGGRAMDPNARAKYLNSPETPLFDKGRTLYNHGPARAAVGRDGTLVVAEGYMDVIALVEAGFGGAVAPLGTAITEAQLKLIWDIAPEPVIALDGDKAGIRAALRLIDLALPLVAAGTALRFAVLPDGLDPDELIRARGAPAMQAALEGARPMIELIWQRETEGRSFDSPERRAALDRSLRGLLARIGDPGIRAHYEADLKARRAAFFRPATPIRPPGRPWTPTRTRGAKPPPLPPEGASPSARASLLARPEAGPEAVARVRESAILWGCLNHPGIAAELDGMLERAPFLNPDLASLRSALLAALPGALASAEPAPALRAAVTEALGHDPAPRLCAIGQVRINPCLGPEADAGLARDAIAEDLARHSAELGLSAELREATEQAGGGGAELDWRLSEAAEARNRAARGAPPQADSATGEEESLSAILQNHIDRQIWMKRKP